MTTSTTNRQCSDRNRRNRPKPSGRRAISLKTGSVTLTDRVPGAVMAGLLRAARDRARLPRSPREALGALAAHWLLLPFRRPLYRALAHRWDRPSPKPLVPLRKLRVEPRSGHDWPPSACALAVAPARTWNAQAA